MLYKKFIRPLFFRLSPSSIHHLIVELLALLGKIPGLCQAIHLLTNNNDTEIPFPFKHSGPIGLSAGFDKEAKAYDLLGALGFGFIEIGTVTLSRIDIQKFPAIDRYPDSKELITRTGFNNPGAKRIKERLKKRTLRHYGLGININSLKTGKDAAKELIELYDLLAEDIDYFTINCPADYSASFIQLLTITHNHYLKSNIRRPILLKLSGDISQNMLQKIPLILSDFSITGVIACGPVTQVKRLEPDIQNKIKREITGGICGQPIFKNSLNIVHQLRQLAGPDLFIIGAGGIITEEDADNMLKAGADLIQIYSAFIFEGPSIVSKISKKLSHNYPELFYPCHSIFN